MVDDDWYALAALPRVLHGSGEVARCVFGVFLDWETLKTRPLAEVLLLGIPRNGSGLLGLPGGGQERWDVSATGCLERELQEETGLRLPLENAVPLGMAMVGHRECTLMAHVVEGLSGYRGQPLTGSDPHVHGVVVPWHEFKQNTFEANVGLEPKLAALQAAVRAATES